MRNKLTPSHLRQPLFAEGAAGTGSDAGAGSSAALVSPRWKRSRKVVAPERNASSRVYGTSLTSGTDLGEARKQKNSCDSGSPAVASSQFASCGNVNSSGTDESTCVRKKRVQKSSVSSGFAPLASTRICWARRPAV